MSGEGAVSGGPGRLCPGAAVTLRVCAVGLRPEVPVLRLWGLLGERRADYARLLRRVQAAAADPGGLVARGAELCAGELGLVEVVGLWHRCRVVGRRGQQYRVFLLDEGFMVGTSARYLARGCEELFHLPAEVLGFIVADVMPAGSCVLAPCEDALAATWTVEALEFLSCLHGKEVHGLVQEVMTPQLIVVELPQLVTQMHHLGLARRVTPSWFGQVLGLLRNAQKSEGKENLSGFWGQNYVEMKPHYRGQIQVGSTVSVVVSYVENPSYFWCQLSRSYSDLKELMAEIQEYCRNSSHPFTWPNSVCLAWYSGNNKWYRALIISEVPSAEKVEVVCVDYGYRELVSLTNLRSMNERFLRLEAQAFGCSLYNLIQPNSQDPFAWDEEAIQVFQEYVDTSSHFELKCTVFALASINSKELLSIVDLTTPFQSACQFLTERGVARRVYPEKPLVSSVQLHSYYYSTHDIKIGSEEVVYITHVEDPWTFYCQLERCADVLAQLTDKIDRLSKTITSLKTVQKTGSLCLAKYTDSHWYRAVIRKTKPGTEVFFVDFGNTETIEEDQQLPIPRDACDVLFLPMQAIKCSLPDIPPVPQEATMWFKQAILERHLKAVVVGKESDGKLLMELFDGNTQIKTKLKEESSLINNTGLHRHVENETLWSRNRGGNERKETAESPLNAGGPLESKTCQSEAQGGGDSSKRPFEEADVNLLQPAKKGDFVAALLEADAVLSSKNDAAVLDKAEEETLLSVQMDTQSDAKSDAEGGCIMHQKISDLLQQKIVPALKVSVYVSHVNDPLDFYVQLESEEAQLNSISESLNSRPPTENSCGQLFQAGDLISAIYSEDGLWYRAVVKEKTSDSLICVQYIDYGNISIINVDQARRLPEDLSSISARSIHCFLGGLQCRKNTDWAGTAVLDFTKRTSEGLLTCEFVEKIEDKWEVILSDHHGIITVDLAEENLASKEESPSREILPEIHGEETKQAVETESLERQTASGSEAREKVLEQESLELPLVSDEMEELESLKFLEMLQSGGESENSVPLVSNGEKTAELIPSDVQLALGEKAMKPEWNLSEIPKAEAIPDDWIEVEPPPLRQCSSDDRPAKQMDMTTHDMLPVLGAETGQLLEGVLPDVQLSQDNEEEDLLGLEHAALPSSAESGSQFSLLRKEFTNQMPICSVKSYDCEVENREEGQKRKDCYCGEGWMKQDLTNSSRECGNTCVQSSDRKPGDEEAGKKKNENLASFSAEHEYTYGLKGFAVGSKCVVWTSEEWCEARILEVSEEGTRVLNLSSGREEIVDPENVWNCIPDRACRSSEAITPATEDKQSLPEETFLQEKQTS